MTEMPIKSRPKAILDAALACFNQYGIEATTIDMIRQQSGASVGSIYHHFGSKEDIAAALFIDGMRNFGVLVRERISATHGAEAGIKALVLANIEWISQNPMWAKYCFHHRGAVNQGTAAQTFLNDNKSFHRFLHEWFSPYVISGELRLLTPELMSALVVGATHDYARHWLAGRTQIPLSDCADILAHAAWMALKNT